MHQIEFHIDRYSFIRGSIDMQSFIGGLPLIHRAAFLRRFDAVSMLADYGIHEYGARSAIEAMQRYSPEYYSLRSALYEDIVRDRYTIHLIFYPRITLIESTPISAQNIADDAETLNALRVRSTPEFAPIVNLNPVSITDSGKISMVDKPKEPDPPRPPSKRRMIF